MFILAQIVSLIAIIVNIIAVQFKDKKHILLGVALTNFLFAICYLMLDAYVGTLICIFHTIIVIINSMLEDREKETPSFMILIYILIAIIIGASGYKSVTDLLPILASILFILTLNIGKEKYIRLLLLGNLISWVIYDYFVLAYVAGVSTLVVIGSTLISIYRYDIKNKEQKI